MRSFIIAASGLAAAVLALPQQLDKRGNLVNEVDVVVETVVVTVTVGSPPSSPPIDEEHAREVVPPFWGNTFRTRAPIRPPFASVAGVSSMKPQATPAPIRPPFANPVASQSLQLAQTSAVPAISTSLPVPVRNTPIAVLPPFAPTSIVVSIPSPSTAQPPVAIGVGPSHIPGLGQAYLSAGPEYQNAILYHHNAARANHGAAPLSWDTSAEANARIVAEGCKFAHYLPPNVRQGQNLFTVSGTAFNVTAGITESWYKSEFPAMRPYFGDADISAQVFHDVGHLTQLLWKGTTGVGCASVDCTGRMTVGTTTNSPLNKYTVCNYAPAGNIARQYGANVGIPLSYTNLGSWTD
ncbi:hypothetical protein ACN47E_007161 [Coniothyrium glycines]